MRPHWKKLWSALRAAEVIGPVDNGDRMIAKKGPRRVVKGSDRISSVIISDVSSIPQDYTSWRTFYVLDQTAELLKPPHELLFVASFVRYKWGGIWPSPSQSEACRQSRVSRIAKRMRRHCPSGILAHHGGNSEYLRQENMLERYRRGGQRPCRGIR